MSNDPTTLGPGWRIHHPALGWWTAQGFTADHHDAHPFPTRKAAVEVADALASSPATEPPTGTDRPGLYAVARPGTTIGDWFMGANEFDPGRRRGQTCGHGMRDGRCKMDRGHKGRHATAVHGCDACGITRRGTTPWERAKDGGDDEGYGLNICWFCATETQRAWAAR